MVLDSSDMHYLDSNYCIINENSVDNHIQYCDRNIKHFIC